MKTECLVVFMAFCLMFFCFSEVIATEYTFDNSVEAWQEGSIENTCHINVEGFSDGSYYSECTDPGQGSRPPFVSRYIYKPSGGTCSECGWWGCDSWDEYTKYRCNYVGDGCIPAAQPKWRRNQIEDSYVYSCVKDIVSPYSGFNCGVTGEDLLSNTECSQLCANGEQDTYEEGVDCGGPCESLCQQELISAADHPRDSQLDVPTSTSGPCD